MRTYLDTIAVVCSYSMRIEGRRHFMAAALREEIGEILDALIHVHYTDTESMMVMIVTDSARWQATATIADAAQRYTALTTSQDRQFRNTIRAIAREGLIGNFFQVEFEKIVPSTGEVKYFGTDLNVIPRPEYGPEHEASLGANTAAYS